MFNKIDSHKVKNLQSSNQTKDGVLSPIQSENGKILPTIKLGAEHAEFVRFCATPRELRELKTQGEFARKFGVSPDTLTDWKQMPGFYDLVRIEIRSHEQDGLADVISALRAEAESGDPGAIRLWLQYIGEMKIKGQRND